MNKGWDGKMRNKNMNTIREFVEGCFSGCFILNEVDLIEEDMIYTLAETSSKVEFDFLEEVLLIDLEDKGVHAVISYL